MRLLFAIEFLPFWLYYWMVFVLFKEGVMRGRAPKLGSGKRFARLEHSIARKGNVSDPAAVAAAIGRKKYGPKKMAIMAAKGRAKRAK